MHGSRTSSVARGWSLSSLRFQRTDGPQVWGFDAVRSYPRSTRSHIGLFARDRNNNCYLCQAVKIEGFEGVSPGRNLELAPTLTATRSDERDTLSDDLVAGSTELDAGITTRWGITPNLTLSGTVNPDFSQVEADARQLEVNETFALNRDPDCGGNSRCKGPPLAHLTTGQPVAGRRA